MNWKSKKRTRRLAIASALVLCVGVAVVLADSLGNSLLNGVFQLGPADGPASNGGESGITNILHSSDTVPAYSASPDWADIMQSNGSKNPGGDDRTPATPRGVFNPNSGFDGEGDFVTDDASAGGFPDLTTYVGTGNKNSDPVGSWTWSTNPIPSKDDISNGYVYTKTVNGHKLVFAGSEREVASGDSHVDIEFFQAGLGLSQPAPCPTNACTFTGSNTNGDVLVNMDFSNGGAFGTLSVRRRDENCANPLQGTTCSNNYDLVETLSNAPNGGGCTSDNNICGFNNLGPVATGGWATFDSHDNVIYSLPVNQFTEFGLDITGLKLGNPCFATVEFKSRSSQSFTASLKDFALHSFQACTATARTEIHTGNTPSSPTVDYDPTGKSDVQSTTQGFNTTVHDQTIVTGQLGVATPTGTVTFTQYSDGNCKTVANTETIPLTQVAAPTNTTPGVAAADSSAVTPAAGAAASWTAVYNGDKLYTTKVNATPTCEPVAVAQLASQVITQVQQKGVDVTNTAITNGQPISDVATVSVLPANTSGAPTPTGTVTWNIYPNATCTGTTFTQQSSSTPSSTGSGQATFTTSYTPAPGTFVCFLASFSPSGTAYQPSQSTRPEPICAFPNAGEDTHLQ